MIGTVDEMPTECERSDVTLCGQQQQQREEEPVQQRLTQQTQQINQQQQLGQYKINTVEKSIESESYTMEDVKELATNGEMSTSQTSTTSTTSSTNENGCSNGGSKKSSIISPDPTAYVTKARVTRPTPPPPSYNPMQFVQIKPSHLYQTAQQQLKKAEEVKKIKEIKKEEPEDWQNNLDNWKSSRRKRVEHIIDRVVEVKKLELEEHDRSRRKSKTFSEMIEERSERGTRGRTKLASLAVYNEDESNDLSDLGIGTSSASGKSSLSEDYDNNSVMSDNVTELDKTILLNKNAQQQIQQQNNCKINSNNLISNNNNRSYVSSPGYDTSSSTAPASSPDPCEYTYEGAIQDYKQRVSRASSSGIGNGYKLKTSASKESTPERQTTTTTPIYPTRRGSKIEDRLIGFEVSSPSDSQECVEKQKVVVPKIDISKRKEVFEQTTQHTKEPKSNASTTNGIPKVTLRERFNAPTAKITETNSKQDLKRMSGDMTSIRDRMQNLEQQKNSGAVSANGSNNNKLVDITVPPLKDRLSCLHSAASKEDVKKKPVQLVDDRQLEIMKSEEENAQLRLKAQQMSNNLIADIETELDNTLQQLTTAAVATAKEEEVQLNAAIAALEVEEQKLEAASNAVHKMEAEFAELSDQALLNTTQTTTTTTTTNDMEFSINEALELALQEIDKEPNLKNKNNTANINNLPACSKKNNNITFNQPNQNKLNKTDEEKEMKAVEKDNAKNGVAVKVEVEDEEEKRISKEPIYENVSTTTINNNNHKSTRTTAIIPQKQQREIINHDYKNNNDNTAKNLKLNDNHKNNKKNSSLIIDTNETNKNDKITNNLTYATTTTTKQQQTINTDTEAFYQVPKSIVTEPYYDAPKNLRPVPVYENIDVFYNGLDMPSMSVPLEPPKEKPPPPPIESPPPLDETDSIENGENWSLDNTYETISADVSNPSPPIKRMNSTKRIKKELRNKRSSFLGIEADDDDDAYLQLTVAPPPDMAQLLQEERRLEKQLYLKAAGMCDSSDTGESRDSGVSENHSRQSSEHYTNSSEENDHSHHLDSPTYQTDALKAAQTPLLQTVKGDCAEAWTNSATVAAAAATQCLTEATATANAKMLSIEEKIREQEEVLRVERELLQLEQEELKRQRENLMIRENMARRELQHGAKMLMSANRHSLQDLDQNNAVQPIAVAPHNQDQVNKSPMRQQTQQQIYANLPNNTKRMTNDTFCHQLTTDYRKSMSDINEFTKRSMLPPIPPTKPLRAMQAVNNLGNMPSYGGSLIKIATPTAAPRATHIYSNYASHYQSVQNLPQLAKATTLQYGNMTRNTLHALSATPKPKYTDGWVQVQSAAALQQKRKSLPDSAFNNTATNYNNHWLVQEAEQRRISAEDRRASLGNKLSNGSIKNKPLPDSIIQTLTERVQSKGLGERKRLDQMNSTNLSPLHSNAYQQLQLQKPKHTTTKTLNLYNEKSSPQKLNGTPTSSPIKTPSNGSVKTSATPQEKILSVSGKKKCSHCGDELGRGAAMTIESLLLFYHINCFKCCVCHVQLGDGLNGTDVRVRNNKLHCQNCYSSDDGIKFSCV